MAAVGWIFDDDEAADWVASLLETDSVDSVAETLMDVLATQKETLAAPLCSRAVAAAEVIAALNGRGSSDLPAEIRSWAAARLGRANAAMTAAAAQAIDAVMTGSELDQLWQESEQYTAWRDRMTDLSRRLR